jgi:pyruvate dehydrogenase E2 component (dihydrolipoamide acetyltransferase)
MSDMPVTSTVDFNLPSLGSDMDGGRVIRWRVAVGDSVHKGDTILDVDTEKSEIEVEVWQDAVVSEILVPEGAEVPVGTTLARLSVGAGAPLAAPSEMPSPTPPAPSETPSPTPPAGESSEPQVAAVTSPPPVGPSSPLPTPRTVYWPSPISAHRAPPAPAVVGVESLSRSDRRQAAVASAMERSNREIPHFHLSAEIDVSAAIDWVESTNSTRPPPERILLAALLLAASARAAKARPRLNGTWTDGVFRPADSVQLGVAVHIRGGGLMTPVLPDANQMELTTLMVELRGMVTRARTGKLRSTDIGEPTITVTNVGDGGADSVFGLIRPPQVALVGFGRVRDRAVVVDGQVVVRPVIVATVSMDHRVNNGHTGSAYLDTLAKLIRSPEELE